MYVLFSKRVVKENTGKTEKFAPRTANRTVTYISGPFVAFKVAQRAVLTALGIHTCLDAQVWSEKQIREQAAKGYGTNGHDFSETLAAAIRLLDAAKEAP